MAEPGSVLVTLRQSHQSYFSTAKPAQLKRETVWKLKSYSVLLLTNSNTNAFYLFYFNKYWCNWELQGVLKNESIYGLANALVFPGFEYLIFGLFLQLSFSFSYLTNSFTTLTNSKCPLGMHEKVIERHKMQCSMQIKKSSRNSVFLNWGFHSEICRHFF